MLTGRIYARVRKDLIVIFIRVHRALQHGFGIRVQVCVGINLLFFCSALCICLENRDFPRLDIHRCRLDTLVLSGCSGNIGIGIILHTAIGKSSFETVAAFAFVIGSRQGAVDLGGALLRLHIHRLEILVAAAYDTAGQVVFQIADGYGAAHAHIGVFAAAGTGRKASRDLIVCARNLVGKCAGAVRRSRDSIIQHKGMDILLGPIVVHHARTGNIRTVALGGADAHACCHLEASLGGRVCNRLHLPQGGIPQQCIHIPAGAVHGEGAANAHLGCSRFIITLQGVFDVRAAEGDGSKEIRRRKGDGIYISRGRNLFLYHYVIHYGVRPSTQEGQGYTALDADRCACTAGVGIGSLFIVFRCGIRAALLIRICRRAGFTPRARCVGGVALVLGSHLVLFQIFGILLGLTRFRFALLGPFGPLLGVSPFVCILVLVLCIGGDSLGFGIVLEHTHGYTSYGDIPCSDASQRLIGRRRTQFCCEGISCNASRQRCVLIDFFGGFFRVCGISGRRAHPAAIVTDHGNAVHVIVDNAHAEAKSFGAFIAHRLAAGRVINISRVGSCKDNRAGGSDCDLIIQRQDTIAVPIAQGRHP